MFGKVLLTFGLIFLIVVFLAIQFPINHTTSMPRGIYRFAAHRIERGAIAGACIPDYYALLARERGYLQFGICPCGVRPVMKYVAAVPGDSVQVTKLGVSVNGYLIHNTSPLRTDSRGRKLPQQLGYHIVGLGEYWLISNQDTGSFDSRYFGPVSHILGVVEPLLTENRTAHSDLIGQVERNGAMRR